MRFLPIPGYPNYQIREDGCIRRKIGPDKWREVKATWDSNHHYRIVALWENGIRSTHMLHHLVAAAHGLSLADAKRCIYGCYHLTPGVRDHVREALAQQVEKWMQDPDQYHDEILYYQEFLRQMSTETGNRYEQTGKEI